MRKVVLKKTTDEGKVLIGTEFEWTYVTMPRHQAEHRASKALLRQFPGEKREWWKVQDEVLPDYCQTKPSESPPAADETEAPAAA